MVSVNFDCRKNFLLKAAVAMDVTADLSRLLYSRKMGKLLDSSEMISTAARTMVLHDLYQGKLVT